MVMYRKCDICGDCIKYQYDSDICKFTGRFFFGSANYEFCDKCGKAIDKIIKTMKLSQNKPTCNN